MVSTRSLKWLDRNRGGYHYCTRGSAAQSQIVPGQTLMARGGKTAARNRSSVVSRRTAVPDAIVNFYWEFFEMWLQCVKFVILTVDCDFCIDIWMCVWVLWGSWFLQWSVMTSGYCGFVTAVLFLFDLVPRIKLWCHMINLESIDCHLYRHLLQCLWLVN